MDKKEFENLGVQDKEIIFNEMLELVTLIYENPVSIEGGLNEQKEYEYKRNFFYKAKTT